MSINQRFLVGVLLRFIFAEWAALTLDRGASLIAFCTLMIATDSLLAAYAIILALFQRGNSFKSPSKDPNKSVRIVYNAFLVSPLLVQILSLVFEEQILAFLTKA